MVYAGWLRSPGREPADRVALLGVNEDGTDYQTYAGDQGLRVKQMPAPTANGLVVFVEADAHRGRRRGPARLGEPGAPAAQLPLADRRGRRPLPRAVAAARRARARRLAAELTRSGGPPFAIYRFDPATGRAREGVRGAGLALGPGEARRAPPDARRALERRARRRPRGQALHDRRRHPGAGPGAAEGDGEERCGSSRAWRRRRTGPSCGGSSARSRSPTTAPTRCRSRRTRRCSCELLDADGTALRTSAWLWVRNHAAQGCVGCHEDPERTPPNRLMKALPAPAPVLNPPPEKRRTLTDAPGCRGRDARPVGEPGCHPRRPRSCLRPVDRCRRTAMRRRLAFAAGALLLAASAAHAQAPARRRPRASCPSSPRSPRSRASPGPAASATTT